LPPDQHVYFEQTAVRSLFDFADRHLLGTSQCSAGNLVVQDGYSAKSDTALGRSSLLEVFASAKDPNPFARPRFSTQSALAYRRPIQDQCHTTK
jgi:hypothetical protein